MRKFTPFEDAFIRAHYLTMPKKRMSTMLGRSETTARQRMVLLGIETPPEISRNFQYGSYFTTGHRPQNKGKKISEYCSKEAIDKIKSTQFRKGNLPQNHKPVGTQRLTKDGYLEIKVAEPNKWKGKHIVEWVKRNGPLPKGCMVVFKSQNKFCTCVNNIEMITRHENMKRNTVHNYPKEIALTVQLRGALNRQINKHLKRLV